MNTKQLLIGVLATFLTLGLFSTAFASNLTSIHSSEGGDYGYNFNAPETKADIAAKNHEYDLDQLAKIGTEGGVWEHSFNAPKTKADVAAMNHVYDPRDLAEVGTEGGLRDRGFQCTSC